MERQELNREVALALGWVHRVPGEESARGRCQSWAYEHWHAPGSVDRAYTDRMGHALKEPPDWAGSLDQCYAPGGPVEALLAMENGVRWTAMNNMVKDRHPYVTEHDWALHMTAADLCRALLSAKESAAK